MSVRFAPSPTGTFHIGNLRTAWISHAWAKTLGLPWVLRFENIDAPRNVLGAQAKQTDDMARLGCVADQVLVQSDQHERHWEVFLKFHTAGLVYPCFCSRKMVRDALESSASAPHAPVAAYTGKCRSLRNTPQTDLPTLAWRIRMPDETGRDDFIIARSSVLLGDLGLPPKESFAPAYHWACAIDDHDGDHTLLVRAWDLEEAAVQQKFIFDTVAQLERSGRVFPSIFHCSLVVTEDGNRLEKRTKGVTLDELTAAGTTPDELVARFKKSFSGDWNAFSQGAIFGERERVLPLKRL